jgi:putative tryptophan/tyrosine transport system substrate-binding protein
LRLIGLAVVLALGLTLEPLAAEAQQAGKVYRLGWFAFSPPTTPETVPLYDAFVQELRAQGFVEGQNVRIERRYTEGQEESAAASAAEFVSMKVDLILATYSGAVRAAKEATSTIPIVMAAVANPERQGLVASLARPGGNVTGTSSIGAESGAKLLQIAKEALPQRSRLAIFWNPKLPISALSVRETEVPAATALGMPPILVGVGSPADLERALDTITRERIDVLYPHLALWPHRQQIVDFAIKHRLPVVTAAREWTQIGGLISYGPDLRDTFRRSAMYVVKILKGAKPADLPVEQPTKFELVINLKTARALGLTIPPSVLGRADQVIE